MPDILKSTPTASGWLSRRPSGSSFAAARQASRSRRTERSFFRAPISPTLLLACCASRGDPFRSTDPVQPMSLLCNLTGYGAVTLPSMGRDGRDLTLAVTAARYRLPQPTDAPESPLMLDPEQPEPPLGDVYCGAPGKSGLRIEGQAAFVRPATDITIAGHARALHDEPVTSMRVAVRIGACSSEALVVGDRIWDVGLGSRVLKMSPPRPFVAIPLVWERAFGGSIYDDRGELVDHEPRNPVGRGMFRDREAARGQL